MIPVLVTGSGTGTSSEMVSLLLSITFGCGLFIAVAHVRTRAFVAPVYDVVANLLAFTCSALTALLLGHLVPGLLSLGAVGCWVSLAFRTARAAPSRRNGMADHRSDA